MAFEKDRLDPLIHPVPRLLWGLVLMVVFMTQRSLFLTGLLVVLFFILGKVTGKRISIPYFLFFNLSIGVFGLLAPRGLVFFELGPWPLTWGALEDGLLRGLTLTGMVFISLFSISEKLRLPGALGKLLSLVFFYFHSLLRERKTIRRASLWEDVDALLSRIYNAPVPEAPPQVAGTQRRGWVVMAVVGGLLTAAAALDWVGIPLPGLPGVLP